MAMRLALSSALADLGRVTVSTPLLNDASAIDRAIKDEEQLPPDYAKEEPVAVPASNTNALEGSNVVDVDFDPA